MALVTDLVELKKVSSPIETKEELAAIEEALRVAFTLISNPHKVGLSANQIGILKSVAYIKVAGRETFLVNPIILEKEGKQITVEQCLSLPGLNIQCDRAETLTIETGLGEDRHTEFRDGYEAIVIQHEIDHLNGKTILDRKHRRK